MYSFAQQNTNKRLVLTSSCGWSVYNYRLPIVQYLLKQGFEVHIIAGDDKYLHYLNEEGCNIHKIKINNRGMNILHDCQLFFTLLRLYRKIKPALIFHYFVKPNIYGSLAAAVVKIPSIAVVAGLGYSFLKKSWLQFLVRFLYKQSLRYSFQVWFQNSEDADLFVKYKMVLFDQTRVIPGDGIETKLFVPSPNKMEISKPFTFIMAVRLLKSKGIQYYATAAKKLKEKGLELECQLIGPVEINHPDSISGQQLQEWQNKGFITYRGFEENVKLQLSKCDCLVLPSYYHEGTPRSLMEACSLGLPVIASDTKGCRNIIKDRYNGFLCRAKDSQDLADKMEKMMQLQLADRTQMGQNGRQKMIAEYDIEILFTYYQHVLDVFIPKQQTTRAIADS